jgi:adenylate cyclase
MASKKILVIDDKALIAEEYHMAFDKTGHELFHACNGEQAIEMAMVTNVDMVIVDAALSGMTCIETFDVIRQTDPGTIGVLVTGHDDIEKVIEAMNHGFSGIIEVPLDAPKLVKTAQEAFALSELREENSRLQAMLPLYKLGEKFLAAASLRDVYNLLLDAISQQIKVPTISVMMFVEEEACMHIVASRGINEKVAAKVAVKSGEQIAGWVYEHGEAVILNKDTQKNSPLSKYLQRSEITASISFPLIGREKILGVLNISQTAIEVAYSQSDLEILSVICEQAVMAIENVTHIGEREDNARTRALFEQYVAPEVAEILISSKENLMEIGGVKDLSILFADIRNFTLAVQHLSHYDIRLFLTEFFDLFSDVAFSWKGTLDKFMGDAALVSFGAPIELEKPSEASVFTAVELSLGFEELRKKWLKKSDVFNHLGLGIGLSRGEVFHGNVGSSRRLDYTVIGTEVNIAQRLASLTESGKILITESVYNDVKGVFSVQEEATRKIRGLEHEIKLYAIQADSIKLP